MTKKLKLAIISSYNEFCGNATYAKALENAMSCEFDVEVLDLKTATLLRSEVIDEKFGDKHIDELCKKLKEFDVVNLHLEWGLYGISLEQIERRLIKLASNANNIIATVHSLHFQDNNFKNMITKVFAVVSKADKYIYIAHLPKDREVMNHIFGLKNVIDFPVVYLTMQEREHYLKTNVKAWKEKLGFKESDIIISRLGFFAEHKDQLASLKSLSLLPENYKLVFIGGQVPAGIKMFEMDRSIEQVINFIDEFDANAIKERNAGNKSVTTLGDRVRFMGNVSDDELYKGVAASDFITLTHREVNQSASGIASISFELQKKMVLAYNFMFMEYEKYYPECFEFFNIGNHYELRDKVLCYDKTRLENLNRISPKYSLNSLRDVYKIFSEQGVGEVVNYLNRLHPDYSNVFYLAKLRNAPAAMSSSSNDEVNRLRAELNDIYNSKAWKMLHKLRQNKLAHTVYRKLVRGKI